MVIHVLEGTAIEASNMARTGPVDPPRPPITANSTPLLWVAVIYPGYHYECIHEK